MGLVHQSSRTWSSDFSDTCWLQLWMPRGWRNGEWALGLRAGPGWPSDTSAPVGSQHLYWPTPASSKVKAVQLCPHNQPASPDLQYVPTSWPLGHAPGLLLSELQAFCPHLLPVSHLTAPHQMPAPPRSPCGLPSRGREGGLSPLPESPSFHSRSLTARSLCRTAVHAAQAKSCCLGCLHVSSSSLPVFEALNGRARDRKSVV